MDIARTADAVMLLPKRVKLGKSTLCIVTYLYHGSDRWHDSVLTKFCNAFFATLPENNLLSRNAPLSQTLREEFARRVDNSKEYYRSAEY